MNSTYKGNEVVSLYMKMKPGMVFVDFKKLQNDGIYAIRKIREVNPSIKIILV